MLRGSVGEGGRRGGRGELERGERAGGTGWCVSRLPGVPFDLSGRPLGDLGAILGRVSQSSYARVTTGLSCRHFLLVG